MLSRALFDADLGNVARIARIVLPAIVPVVCEVRRRFRNEFDYAREARDMEAIGQRQRAAGRRVVVPRPFLELTTERVLVSCRLSDAVLVFPIPPVPGCRTELISPSLPRLWNTFQVRSCSLQFSASFVLALEKQATCGRGRTLWGSSHHPVL